MIKVNELRVGNLVLYKQDNDELPVLKIDGDSKTVCLDLLLGINMEVGEEDIDPISLTPEWLERCGFVKLERREYYELNGICICHEEDNDFKLIHEDAHEGDIITIGSPFQNLHQLQNLYHALTGEEVQIKLP